MGVGLRAVVGLAAALAFGGAAHAGEFDGAFGPAFDRVQFFDADDGYGPRPAPRWYGPGYDDREPGRFYGRPVYERPRPVVPIYDAPPWQRPGHGRPHWVDEEECRIVVKRRINRWGERVVRRIRICD